MDAPLALDLLAAVCRELADVDARQADLLAERGEAVWTCRHDVQPPITWPEIARTAGVTEVAVTRAYQRAVQRRAALEVVDAAEVP